MAAAYAVALQLLLTGLVFGELAPVTGDAFAICIGNHDGASDEQKPADRTAHHQHCAICSVANAPAPTPPHGAIDASPSGFGIAVYGPAWQRIIVAKHRTPQLSQGPPRSA